MKTWLDHTLLAIISLLAFTSCSPLIQKSASPDIPPTPTTNNIITLHYNERPPYLVTTEDGVGGLTGGPATLVFEKINIPFQWKQTPSKRQMYLLQQNKGRDCLVGWYKQKEREEYAKYTLPIFQEKPQLVLTRADNEEITAFSTIDELFTNSQLILLVKDGYSYGDYLDEKIEKYNPRRTETTVENNGMLRMIYAGHADYLFIAPEEADGVIRTSEFDFHDFKFVHLEDVPQGEKRYILCSQQVEDSIIEQLNAAIRQYVTLSEP